MISYEEFRKTAQGTEDIRDWIFHQLQVNNEGISQYSSGDDAVLTLKTLGFRNDEQNPKNTWMQANFKLVLPEGRAYVGELPEIPGLRITLVERPTGSANVITANIQIPTHNWPAIAAKLMFTLRQQNSPLELVLAPYLVSQCFEKLSAETYLNLIQSELVPHDEQAFIQWLMRSLEADAMLEPQVNLPQNGFC